MDIEPDCLSGRTHGDVDRRVPAKLFIAGLLVTETALVYFYFRDWTSRVFCDRRFWFVLDAAVLWKNRPTARRKCVSSSGVGTLLHAGLFWNWSSCTWNALDLFFPDCRSEAKIHLLEISVETGEAALAGSAAEQIALNSAGTNRRITPASKLCERCASNSPLPSSRSSGRRGEISSIQKANLRDEALHCRGKASKGWTGGIGHPAKIGWWTIERTREPFAIARAFASHFSSRHSTIA